MTEKINIEQSVIAYVIDARLPLIIHPRVKEPITEGAPIVEDRQIFMMNIKL